MGEKGVVRGTGAARHRCAHEQDAAAVLDHGTESARLRLGDAKLLETAGLRPESGQRDNKPLARDRRHHRGGEDQVTVADVRAQAPERRS